MKTIVPLPRWWPLSPKYSIILGFFASVSTLGRLTGAEPGSEAKTHTLFMGLDVSVEHQKAFYRVKDVSDDQFVITAKGLPVFLPVNRASHNLKISNALKLTSASASIMNLTSERAYTPAANPNLKQMKNMRDVSAALEEKRALAIDKYSAIEALPYPTLGTGDGIQVGAAAAARGPNSLEVDDILTEQVKMYQAADMMANSDLTTGGFYEEKARLELALERFDAIDVKFELSSETPLSNAYLLLVARFREPQEAASSARNWLYATSVDLANGGSRKVHIFKGGFPPGYILEDFQVHLYNRGEEVATNVSAKRVELTRDEAFDYVKLQYFSSHKGANIGATPAMGKLPSDFQARLSGGQISRTYYVKVTKDGMVSEAFLDQSCSEKIEDPYLQSVVKNIRFKPALENGKPVEAIAPLKIEDLRL